MGLFSSVTKPFKGVVNAVKDVVGGVTGAVNDVLSPITPWNDNTTTGRLANMALLAAAGYGVSQLASGAGAAEGVATAGTGVSTTGTAPAMIAGEGATGIASTGATGFSASGAPIFADTGLATTGSGGSVGLWDSAINSSQVGAQAAAEAAANAGTAGAVGAGGGSFLSSLGATAKANPLLTSILGISAASGIGSYLTAQEQTELQKEAMKPKELSDEAKAQYGEGSRVGSISQNGSARPTLDTRQALNERMEQMYTSSPDYAQGFNQALMKLTGMSPAQLEQFSSSASGQLMDALSGGIA